MKILFILEYYIPHIGGVESLFKALIERLDHTGHHVTVLTNRYDPSLQAEERFGQNGSHTSMVCRQMGQQTMYDYIS